MGDKASQRLTDLVADFIYEWEDTGENPSSAAARLLLRMVRVECLDQALQEIRGGLDQDVKRPAMKD
jgi:hypothetical protein